LSLGRWGSLPLKLGSTQKKPTKIAYQATLSALEPAFDPTDDTYHQIETFAHARIEGMVWGAGQRLANQADPARMLEMLPEWEGILGLNPPPGTSDNARRAAVAGRLRGLQNNAIPDIEDVAQKIMGANYEEVVTVDPDDVVEYWPGDTPGPPGFEWASNVATIAVRVNKNGLDDSAFLRKVGRLRDTLERFLPAWMTFTIGVGSEFIVNQSIVGEDLL
jgi:uncharacterized protein YmfQ (DUF2313 family)